MPTYPYECTACGDTFDAVQRMTDQPLTECPACGKKSLRRIICVPMLLLPRKGRPDSALRPNGEMNGVPAYLPPADMGGLYTVTRAGDSMIIHPNLAGPPPGFAPEDGRVVIVKEEKKIPGGEDKPL